MGWKCNVNCTILECVRKTKRRCSNISSLSFYFVSRVILVVRIQTFATHCWFTKLMALCFLFGCNGFIHSKYKSFLGLYEIQSIKNGRFIHISMSWSNAWMIIMWQLCSFSLEDKLASIISELIYCFRVNIGVRITYSAISRDKLDP